MSDKEEKDKQTNMSDKDEKDKQTRTKRISKFKKMLSENKTFSLASDWPLDQKKVRILGNHFQQEEAIFTELAKTIPKPDRLLVEQAAFDKNVVELEVRHQLLVQRAAFDKNVATLEIVIRHVLALYGTS